MPETTQGILLFDIDNTLIDRDAAFCRFAQSFLATHAKGFQEHAPEVALQKILELDVHGQKDRTRFCQELLAEFPGIALTAQEIWQEHQSLPEFVIPDPLALALIQRLSQHFTLAIASNGSGCMQRRKLNQAGLTQFFSLIFISGEIGHQKPDIEFYRHILYHCQTIPLVMIGDDHGNDILPAKSLGMKTIFVNSVGSHPGASDLTIASLHSLEEALSCIL